MEKAPVHGNFTMDEMNTKGPFQHSWWRILLIIFAVIAFIITCVFNGLASGGPNGIFNQRTGSVSDQNLTDFTPAGRLIKVGHLQFGVLFIFGKLPG
jgi:hypothetical protein